jgi:hypothetical protein
MKKILCLSTLFVGCYTAAWADNVQPKVTLDCQTVGKNIQQCLLQPSQSPAQSTRKNLYGFVGLPYALCSRSLCNLDAKNPKLAHCTCSIPPMKGWKAASIGPNTYEEAKPTYDAHKQLITVQSNYSMANVTNVKAPGIACKSDQPAAWTNCFGVRCQVTNATVKGVPTQVATCTCPVTESQDFMITGPGDQSKCHTAPGQVWSGTTPQTSDEYGGNPIAFLYQKFFPSSPPAKA